jgi:Glycosyltransferase family 87
MHRPLPVAALDKAYLYPPAFAAAFAPLTRLPPRWGYALRMALEVIAALLLARTSAALVRLDDADTDASPTALTLALALLPLAWSAAFAVAPSPKFHA